MLVFILLIFIIIFQETRGREAALEAILNCAESLVRHKTEAKHSIKARSQILDVVMRHLQNSRPDAISLQVTSALVYPLINLTTT